MCKSKMAIVAVEPRTRTSRAATSPSTRSRTPSSNAQPSSSGELPPGSTGNSSNSAAASSSDDRRDSWQTSSAASSHASSLSSLRDYLPEKPHIYDFAEICAATNNFLAKRYSSSSSAACWRCSLRGRDAIVFQRKLWRPIDPPQLRERLSAICRSHHVSLVKLLGASVSGGFIYLAYEFVSGGASLADCLRNPRNPNFTVLSTWMSRMQVAADLAHGLDYHHHSAGLSLSLVHNHIKSGSVIVTDPSFNARICHFGTADLCGEPTAAAAVAGTVTDPSGSGGKSEKLERSESGAMRFEGARGYMAPEFRSSGVGTQKSDVYAFGVVILELLSAEEPLRFRFDVERGDFMRTSVIETARAVVAADDCGGSGGDGRPRLRRWVDGRLRDSFPVEVARKVTQLALDCVHVDPDRRPDMRRVAGKISKLYLESRIWSDAVRPPATEILSASFAPR